MHFCCVRVTDWIVENNPVSRLVKINILKLEVKFRRVWSSASLVDCRNKGPRKCLTFRTGCYLLSLMLELNSHWSPKPIGWFYVFWYRLFRYENQGLSSWIVSQNERKYLIRIEHFHSNQPFCHYGSHCNPIYRNPTNASNIISFEEKNWSVCPLLSKSG
jgi:hypothetical protein